ncbi:hypothetical protein G9A89_009129 [Geosiphon pyriformis]|nr:hypothetical protein G9A89_009129 [Geosiphon pyriformis]
MVFKPVLSSATISGGTTNHVTTTQNTQAAHLPTVSTAMLMSPNATPLKSTPSSSSFTPPNATQQTPITVNATTQKDQKEQKVIDGAVKKIPTPRKRKTPTKAKAKASKISTVATDGTTANESKPPTSRGKRGNAKNAKNNLNHEEINGIDYKQSHTSQVTPKNTVTDIMTPNEDYDQPEIVNSPGQQGPNPDNSRKRKSASTGQSSAPEQSLPETVPLTITEKKAKRPKKIKDPNAPKRPMNSYMEFCRAKRPEIRKENPDLKYVDIGKILSEMWRKMSDSEKEPYHEAVRISKERYAEQCKAYQASQVTATTDETPQLASIPFAKSQESEAIVLPHIQNMITCEQQNFNPLVQQISISQSNNSILTSPIKSRIESNLDDESFPFSQSPPTQYATSPNTISNIPIMPMSTYPNSLVRPAETFLSNSGYDMNREFEKDFAEMDQMDDQNFKTTNEEINKVNLTREELKKDELINPDLINVHQPVESKGSPDFKYQDSFESPTPMFENSTNHPKEPRFPVKEEPLSPLLCQPYCPPSAVGTNEFFLKKGKSKSDIENYLSGSSKEEIPPEQNCETTALRSAHSAPHLLQPMRTTLKHMNSNEIYAINQSSVIDQKPTENLISHQQLISERMMITPQEFEHQQAMRRQKREAQSQTILDQINYQTQIGSMPPQTVQTMPQSQWTIPQNTMSNQNQNQGVSQQIQQFVSPGQSQSIYNQQMLNSNEGEWEIPRGF